MSPSSRCRPASYEKVACLHLQKPRLEFYALHEHRVKVTVLKFRLGQKTLPLQPEGFLFKDKVFQVSAPHESTQVLVKTTAIQNITCPKLQVRGRKDQWWK